MLIIDGTIGSDVSAFLERLHEDTPPCKIMMYTEWLATQTSHAHAHCNSHHDQPEGIVYLRVSPKIAFARIQKRALPAESGITLDYIEQIYQQKNELFIENRNSPTNSSDAKAEFILSSVEGTDRLQTLPLLVLNGNIDFQTDFSQFYNHLFYIKKLLNEIQKKKDIALGIYKEKLTQRHCC